MPQPQDASVVIARAKDGREEAGAGATRWRTPGTYAITLGNNGRLSLFLA
ncbi:hypothetical protein ACIBL8_45735 [Streptomyces sp. NPDC050523]